MDLIYPADAATRTEWIVAQRPQRNAVDANRPYAFFVEDECSATGEVVPVATVFLTNRECPWRCAMCDLWKNTLTEPVPPGAIPRQIGFALERLPHARQIKLYNSGSFFDARAIPAADRRQIADLLRSFERVIVECHPSLIGNACFEFQQMLEPSLEVAMGLETAHPEVLAKLNKRMTLDDFSRAAKQLHVHGIAMRAFVLVQPPFMQADESLEWAMRSIDIAFDCNATAVSLIPTRGGNGAMESFVNMDQFAPPRLQTLEAAFEYGLSQRRGRVFADLWDLRHKSHSCSNCWPARIDRLGQMNLTQIPVERIGCSTCGGAS